MEKYYKILEIDTNATEEEIKKAFSKLKRKYDPNNYDKESLKQHAQEKTKEIVEAFDKIMNKKRAEKIENEKTKKTSQPEEDESLNLAERLINENVLQRAEEILTNIPQEKRTARWFFLKGAILFKKGWLLEASNFFATAVNLDPSNEEYKKALERTNWQKQGEFNNPNRPNSPFGGPYPTAGQPGCSFCDICTTMMCANICCDCFSPPGGGFRGC